MIDSWMLFIEGTSVPSLWWTSAIVSLIVACLCVRYLDFVPVWTIILYPIQTGVFCLFIMMLPEFLMIIASGLLMYILFIIIKPKDKS